MSLTVAFHVRNYLKSKSKGDYDRVIQMAPRSANKSIMVTLTPAYRPSAEAGAGGGTSTARAP